jgi:hypothetical protein
MSQDDFAFEPQPGLPAPLPKGERILWQGRPDTTALAREAFLTRWVAGYFALVAGIRLIVAAAEGPLPAALALALPYVLLGLATVGILRFLAWAQARATVYTITNARVLLRVGAALSVTWNLPFRQIETARLDLRPGGTGTIALEPAGDQRLAYIALWPHVRPWRMKKTEPALRCIPDAARVAQILAEAAETRVSLPEVTRAPAPAVAVAAE